MGQYSALNNDPFVINVDKGMYTKGRFFKGYYTFFLSFFNLFRKNRIYHLSTLTYYPPLSLSLSLSLSLCNREGEVQLILSKTQKYLHVLLQPFLCLDMNVKLNWYILFSTTVC